MSGCAHHDFSDTKTCNPNQPCTAISTIAKDPLFRVSTALLYIRPTESKSNSGDSNDEQPSLERVNSYIDPNQCVSDVPTAIDYSKPDLGLLHLHRDRLAAAAEALGWRNIQCLARTDAALSELQGAIGEHIGTLKPVAKGWEAVKLRILVGKQNEISVDSSVIGQISPNAALPVLLPQTLDLTVHALRQPCKVYLDSQPTRPSTLTSHKSIHRCCYDAARHRAGITKSPPMEEEVLLYNDLDEVMEGSVCTVYFLRDGRWITPAAICGPHIGVTRRLAIEHGLASQGTIELSEVTVDEPVWLSNAVRGFFPGRIRYAKNTPSAPTE